MPEQIRTGPDLQGELKAQAARQGMTMKALTQRLIHLGLLAIPLA